MNIYLHPHTESISQFKVKGTDRQSSIQDAHQPLIILPIQGDTPLARTEELTQEQQTFLKNIIESKTLSQVKYQYLPSAEGSCLLLIDFPADGKVNAIEKVFARVSSVLQTLKIDCASLLLDNVSDGYVMKSYTYAACVKMALTMQRFHTEKTSEKPHLLKTFHIRVHADLGYSLAELEVYYNALIESMASIIYHVELCPETCNPNFMAQEAKKLEKLNKNIRVRVFDGKEVYKMGMHAMHAVGRGSDKGMAFCVVEYMGAADKNQDPVVLVGKGVTFDSGGYSLKPAMSMYGMHTDMAGSATVLATIEAAAKIGLKQNIVGLVGFVENLVNGSAYKPGDVVKTKKGITVEITNTDAEGRMVLCDLLTYAEENYTPKVVFDFATLTGAVMIALGHDYTGIWTREDDLAEELNTCAKITNDLVWRMPLNENHLNVLKTSETADMVNLSLTPMGPGSSVAAAFLSVFTEKYPWVHFDIAGSATFGSNRSISTARPLFTVVHYLFRRELEQRGLLNKK